jgi:hypothetical protein
MVKIILLLLSMKIQNGAQTQDELQTLLSFKTRKLIFIFILKKKFKKIQNGLAIPLPKPLELF